MKKIKTRLAAVGTSLLLAGCGSLVLKDYVPPSGPQTATVEIQNRAARQLDFFVMEGAGGCDEQRRVQHVAPGGSDVIRIKAPEPTGLLIVTGEQTATVIRTCGRIYLIRPRVAGHYVLRYEATDKQCRVVGEERLDSGGMKPIELGRPQCG